jgi:hypothetical protein
VTPRRAGYQSDARFLYHTPSHTAEQPISRQELAEHFGVFPRTIPYDLASLCKGRWQGLHTGAYSVHTQWPALPYQEKRSPVHEYFTELLPTSFSTMNEDGVLMLTGGIDDDRLAYSVFSPIPLLLSIALSSNMMGT